MHFIARIAKSIVNMLFIYQYEIRFIAFQKAYKGTLATTRTASLLRY